MRTFTVVCELHELTGNRPPATIADVMVDIGSEYTWLPDELLREAGVTVTKKDIAFAMANGATITRDIGYAYLRSGAFETVDEVVFARPDDMRLLGARTLEGFAARVDSRAKRLVAAGPLPVAGASGSSRGSSAKGAPPAWRRAADSEVEESEPDSWAPFQSAVDREWSR